MSPRKLLLVGVLMIFSGWVGFWFGEERLKFAFANWQPAVVVNKNPVLSGKQADVDFSHFWTVWDKVTSLYVDKSAVDPQKMEDGAIAGMVAALGDPYTMYLPAEQNRESKEALGGEFGGVGIELGFDKNNNLVVMTPLDGSPAMRAGIQAGDVIAHIKDAAAGVDADTAGMSLASAVKLIRGTKGTRVTLTLMREGTDKPWVVDLVRDTIVVKSVTVSYKENNGLNIAWIKLTQFGDLTQSQWDDTVNQVISNKAAGVVLDLRNNPGGYLDGAVYVAGEFLPAGKLVVTQQYGDGSKVEDKVNRSGQLLDMPLVVMVNKGSASAAEILSGALQDYRRAKVVGVQSFGKGSVQQPEDFQDGSGVHVTVAKWLRPSGNWIDKKGITPDVNVEAGNDPTADPQLVKALSLF